LFFVQFLVSTRCKFSKPPLPAKNYGLNAFSLRELLVFWEENPAVKNYLVLLAFAIVIPTIHSCVNAEGTAIDQPEKKESVVKSKKKEKKKPAAVNKKVKQTNRDHDSKKTADVSSAHRASISYKADQLSEYASRNDLSTQYFFLIDMSIASGRNRFFVYNMEKGSIVLSGLVAHGSCNETYLSRPRFSNKPNCGCSSLGRYKVGEFYRGKYGKSFRLHGLDNSNSNAYKRAVVIHGYDCVPDEEISPMVLCNSQGCPMVSYNFFDKLSRIINQSDKPILLWIYQ
jgi:hypothetical protein